MNNYKEGYNLEITIALKKVILQLWCKSQLPLPPSIKADALRWKNAVTNLKQHTDR